MSLESAFEPPATNENDTTVTLTSVGKNGDDLLFWDRTDTFIHWDRVVGDSGAYWPGNAGASSSASRITYKVPVQAPGLTSGLTSRLVIDTDLFETGRDGEVQNPEILYIVGSSSSFWASDTSDVFWASDTSDVFWNVESEKRFSGSIPRLFSRQWVELEFRGEAREKQSFFGEPNLNPQNVTNIDVGFQVKRVSEFLNDVTITDGDDRISHNRDFQKIVQVNVLAIRGSGIAVSVQVVDKTTIDGPRIRVLDKDGNEVEADLDLELIGY